MTNPIGNNALMHTTLDATERAAGAKAAGTTTQPAAASAASASAGTASISGAASVLAVSPADSDVRTGKVAEVKAAIANGTYNISATAVADKLIGHMLGS